MNLSTLFHQCLYFCIVLVIFTLALNFISVLWFDAGAIPVETPMGKAPKDTANETFIDWVDDSLGFSGSTEGFGLLFILVSVGSAIPAMGLTILSGQTTPLAIWVFGMIFWTSYIRALSVLSMVPNEILVPFSVAIMFVFAGAVVAILGYSG